MHFLTEYLEQHQEENSDELENKLTIVFDALFVNILITFKIYNYYFLIPLNK
jgi:hypothetical protein